MPDIDFLAIVEKRLAALGWTQYRLAQEVSGKVTMPTVYSFFAGKPVKTPTLAAIFEALDLTVVVSPKGGRK